MTISSIAIAPMVEINRLGQKPLKAPHLVEAEQPVSVPRPKRAKRSKAA